MGEIRVHYSRMHGKGKKIKCKGTAWALKWARAIVLCPKVHTRPTKWLENTDV